MTPNPFPSQPPSWDPPIQPKSLSQRIEPRKSLSATAYRLHYVTHVIQGEVDEIESAITEEDHGHPNIQLMAKMLQELTQAQERIYAVIHKLPPLDESRHAKPV